MAYDLRAAKLTTAVVRPIAGVAALTSATNKLRSDMQRRVVDAAAAQKIRDVIFGVAARGGQYAPRSPTFAGVDFGGRTPPVDLGAIGAVVSTPDGAPASEPFLHVRVTVRPTDTDQAEETYHYSDIDRPVGAGAQQIQLHGRVLDFSYAARRLSPTYGLARNTATLRLANNDRALDSLFRSPAWLRMHIDIRVGYRTIQPQFYRRVGPIWKVDRIGNITADYVELQLIDATEGMLGRLIPIPSKSDVAACLGYETFGRNFQVPNDNNPFAEVPFGGEWVRPFLLRKWQEGTASFNATLREYCLGITRNQTACMGTTTGAQLRAGIAPDNWRLGVLDSLEEPKTIRLIMGNGITRFPADHNGLLDVSIFSKPFTYTVDDPATGRVTRTWWAVIMRVREQNTANRISERAPWMADLGSWNSGRLLCQWPHGAEGRGWDSDPQGGRHDPASIIEEICARYMVGDGRAVIHRESFERVRNSYSWSGYEFLAGKLTGDETGATPWGSVDAAEFLSRLAQSWEVDLFWGADAKLHVSRATVSQWDMLHRVPGCPVYDATTDVIRNSWQERVPLGSERHGLTNKVTINDLKWYTWPSLVGNYSLDTRRENITGWERTLEGTTSYAWKNTAIVSANGATENFPALYAHNDLMANVVTFSAPLYALELELGEFFRTTHFAGFMSDGGYDQRLLMAEEIGLEWASKQVRIVALDMQQSEAASSSNAMLDDGRGWTRVAADGALAVVLSGGSVSASVSRLPTNTNNASNWTNHDYILSDSPDDPFVTTNFSGSTTLVVGGFFSEGDIPEDAEITAARIEIQVAITGSRSLWMDAYTNQGGFDQWIGDQIQLTAANAPGGVVSWSHSIDRIAPFLMPTYRVFLAPRGAGSGTISIGWVRVIVDYVKEGLATSVELRGTKFIAAGVRVGDLILIDDDERDIHENLEIVAVETTAEGLRVTVDVEPVAVGTFREFTVRRTHLDPPTDAEFPGRYPFGSSMYLRLADATTLKFSDGTPALRIA